MFVLKNSADNGDETSRSTKMFYNTALKIALPSFFTEENKAFWDELSSKYILVLFF